MTRTQLLVSLLACSSLVSAANVPSKPTLDLAHAQQAASAAAKAAARMGAPGGSIAIVDDGGHLVLLLRLDGSFAASAEIATGKARTAAMFQRPTKQFEDIVNGGRTTMVALPDFTPLQGGIPLREGTFVIGAIGVSGAASAQQDEDIALAGANALLPEPSE